MVYAVDHGIVNKALVDAPQLEEPSSPGILPDSPKMGGSESG